MTLGAAENKSSRDTVESRNKNFFAIAFINNFCLFFTDVNYYILPGLWAVRGRVHAEMCGRTDWRGDFKCFYGPLKCRVLDLLEV